MKPKTISFFYNAMNYLIELVLVLVLIAGNDERRMYRRISPVFAAQILTRSYAKTVSQVLKDQRKNPTTNEYDGLCSMIFAIPPLLVV